eukprot:GHVR01110743.1.p2 GENE.GHVR01110743.1~~GHVR01110743.1.p2  ORF type:complete len:120 (+),score=3.61 GHVR01110743.1:322-681(+)
MHEITSEGRVGRLDTAVTADSTVHLHVDVRPLPAVYDASYCRRLGYGSRVTSVHVGKRRPILVDLSLERVVAVYSRPGKVKDVRAREWTCVDPGVVIVDVLGVEKNRLEDERAMIGEAV